LPQIIAVYPQARIASTWGGIMLQTSPPPVRKTQILSSP
jgi:hypothetical protein